jgi:hypothetical protein
MIRATATAFAATVIVLLAAVPGALAASPLSDLVTFQSPSKNVGCALDKAFARCDVRKRDFTIPKKPSDCRLDWGQGLSIDVTGRGQFVCAGDTTLGSGKVLRYGKSMTRGRFTCTSLKTGMRCTNTRNNHGFKLSRQKVTRF